MNRGSETRWPLALAAAVLASCGGGSACPSSDQVRAQLASLGSGQTVTIDGACMLSGPFVVPAGATLHGGTFALAAGDQIRLMPSTTATPTTTIESFHVVGGSSNASVRIDGAGHAHVADASFDLERGFAVVADGSSVTIDRITVVGSYDASQMSLAVPAAPDSNAVCGVVALHDADVRVDGGDLSRLTDGAVFCVDASLTLSNLRMADNRGIGVASYGCSVHADTVEITATIAVATYPGAGITLARSTSGRVSELVSGDHLSIHDQPGFGVLADHAAVTLAEPTMTGLRIAGVWVQDAPSLMLRGGTFDGNGGIAISAVGVATIDVQGTHVSGTINGPLPRTGGLGTDVVADALNVVQRTGVPSTITLADLVLSDNARAGLVLDGGNDPLALAITSTTVSTMGTALGAVAQNVASLPADWDHSIVRGGAATIAADHGAASVVVSNGAPVDGILMPPTIMF